MRLTDYATALIESWETAPVSKRSEIVDRFVALLESEGLRAIGPEIILVVERLLQERSERSKTVLEVARADVFPKKENEKFSVDEVLETDTIVGGFRLRREDEIIDASVGGALAHIRTALTV